MLKTRFGVAGGTTASAEAKDQTVYTARVETTLWPAVRDTIGYSGVKPAIASLDIGVPTIYAHLATGWLISQMVVRT
jgi:hypothetical protein